MMVTEGGPVERLVPILTLALPGETTPAGSKTGFPLRYKDKKTGRLRIKITYTKKGDELCRVTISDTNSKKLKARRKVVHDLAQRQIEKDSYSIPSKDTPLAVQVTFYKQRGKTVKRAYPTVAPDATKLWRALEDDLTGLVWHDDAPIVLQKVRKGYVNGPSLAVVQVFRVEVGE